MPKRQEVNCRICKSFFHTRIEHRLAQMKGRDKARAQYYLARFKIHLWIMVYMPIWFKKLVSKQYKKEYNRWAL